MPYNAELQMLREFFYKHAQVVRCRFCGLPLILSQTGMTFGHRRHPKVKARITQHHEDFNRANNALSNIKDSHESCHKRYHKELYLAQHGGNNVTLPDIRSGDDPTNPVQNAGTTTPSTGKGIVSNSNPNHGG